MTNPQGGWLFSTRTVHYFENLTNGLRREFKWSP
jgi:hypothetical protein